MTGHDPITISNRPKYLHFLFNKIFAGWLYVVLLRLNNFPAIRNKFCIKIVGCFVLFLCNVVSLTRRQFFSFLRRDVFLIGLRSCDASVSDQLFGFESVCFYDQLKNAYTLACNIADKLYRPGPRFTVIPFLSQPVRPMARINTVILMFVIEKCVW